MKDIIGYEGKYAITSCGKVWSYKHKKFLKPQDTGSGYLIVRLYNKDGWRTEYLHRLVAIAYLPNEKNLPEVNHKDECKAHNYSQNLEWCDHKYNVNYGTCKQRGANACKRPVYCIELDRAFNSIKEAAEFSGVTASLVNKCLKGIKKTAGGYHWKYCEE